MKNHCGFLYILFLSIDLKQIKKSFTNVRFTLSAVIINFVFTPLFGYLLGKIFFPGSLDIRIGLLMKEYSPELTEEIQPMVKIHFSQDSEFKEGCMIPLAEADERFCATDERQVAGTAFIGDGRGGLLENLQQELEAHLHNQAWLDYKKGQGADKFQSYMAELWDAQEHALPYLQQFVSLEERESTAIVVFASEKRMFPCSFEGKG